MIYSGEKKKKSNCESPRKTVKIIAFENTLITNSNQSCEFVIFSVREMRNRVFLPNGQA